jgi:unsaturated rhamnogalacturonyl hydrolase
MKSRLILFSLLLLLSPTIYSQESQVSPFKDDLNVKDIKVILKSVADWQIKTPLTHHPLDWTNGALYAGMAEWAIIAGDEKYFVWLKEIGQKNEWKYYEHPKQPLRRYHADDYCVGQTYIELYRKYHDKI